MTDPVQRPEDAKQGNYTQIELADNSIVADSVQLSGSELVKNIGNRTLKNLSDNTGNTEFSASGIYRVKRPNRLFIVSGRLGKYNDLEETNVVLRKIDGKWKTGNVMGFLGYKDERLTITSRFLKESDEGELGKPSRDYFLQYMLQKVLGWKQNLVNLLANDDRNAQIFDLLLLLFPQKLHQALLKGSYREYVRKEHNDTSVRGVLTFNEYIKYDAHQHPDRIWYRTSELSPDNDLMQLIRHTIEVINSFFGELGRAVLSDYRVVQDIKTVRMETNPSYNRCRRDELIKRNKAKTVRGSYAVEEYFDLKELCIAILEHRNVGLAGRDDDELSGVLFDGAWLWEEYINKLFQENKTLKGKMFHPENRTKKGQQKLFAKTKGVPRKVGEIYPDFISNDGRTVIDAKYKRTTGIYGRDYQQVLAYMIRFGAEHGYYVHPLEVGEKEEIVTMNVLKGIDTSCCTDGTALNPDTDIQQVWVKKVGLRIPRNAEDYECFCNLMKEEERKLIDGILHDSDGDGNENDG
ncbi:hypothetical protein [Bifidobacterium sp. ESL0704]|uniref:5-methylcytosine restriction system specificity protein McrC n=1 Tax=Bifidobacterium sp. ESL0704 TaxID=2983219 RepID=UPI0023F934FC|nr:hypothetical protein [Bifidobacterium sp. ESL0704]WEV53030.1 hypothetical protein OZX64_00540 [Bifidobacterium sp. ESL0704]